MSYETTLLQNVEKGNIAPNSLDRISKLAVKKVGDLLEVDFGVSIVVKLQNRTPKNGDIEVGFGAKQLTKGDWGKKSLERQDQMGKEWLLELVTLDDNTLNIADPGDKIEEAIFFKSQSLLLPAEKN